jgi:uncharacterized protein YcbX
MMDVDHRIDVGPIGFTVRIKFPVATATPVPAFVDYAPLHLLTTATLARLARLYPQGQWDPARFRPNVLIDNGDDPSSDEGHGSEKSSRSATFASASSIPARAVS